MINANRSILDGLMAKSAITAADKREQTLVAEILRLRISQHNPLATLAMRERAAAYMEKPTHQGIRPTWPSDIRALPTTFTDAELLAAAMQLPEVRALVEAADVLLRELRANSYVSDHMPEGSRVAMSNALATFRKGAS